MAEYTPYRWCDGMASLGLCLSTEFIQVCFQFAWATTAVVDTVMSHFCFEGFCCCCFVPSSLWTFYLLALYFFCRFSQVCWSVLSDFLPGIWMNFPSLILTPVIWLCLVLCIQPGNGCCICFTLCTAAFIYLFLSLFQPAKFPLTCFRPAFIHFFYSSFYFRWSAWSLIYVLFIEEFDWKQFSISLYSCHLNLSSALYETKKDWLLTHYLLIWGSVFINCFFHSVCFQVWPCEFVSDLIWELKILSIFVMFLNVLQA